MLFTDIKRAHFIAIGGAGMSGIAWVMLKRGIAVSGSDLAGNRMTQRLAEHGARCFIGHAPEQVGDADVVIVSTAIKDSNCELQEAQKRGIPVWHRSEALGALMAAGTSVGITGSHGKTTTTSMVGLIFERAGADPTVVVGGVSGDFGGTAKVGTSDWIVAELDESDGSFLRLKADRAIVTNIDAEHLDHYSNYHGVVQAFLQYIEQVETPPVVCADDPGVQELLQYTKRPVVRYGLTDPDADYTADNLVLSNQGVQFDLLCRGKRLGAVDVSAPGRHNVCNALGALAVAIESDLDPKVCCEALSDYRGVQRRLTVRHDTGGVLMVDDYAHHPSEIAATLAVGREWANERNGRLIALFQPHRYSRTAALHARFGPPFEIADKVIVTDIYSAGEKPIEGVTSELIADSIRDAGQPNVQMIADRKMIAGILAPRLMEGDVVMTLGAGDIWRTCGELHEQIEMRLAGHMTPEATGA